MTSPLIHWSAKCLKINHEGEMNAQPELYAVKSKIREIWTQ